MTIFSGEAAFSYRALEGWMKRASSEVSILRGEFLTCDAELAGGFIALNGVELKRARQADAGALWEAFPSASAPLWLSGWRIAPICFRRSQTMNTT